MLFLLSRVQCSNALIPKSQALWMTCRRSKELTDITSVLCLTQYLTSMENAYDTLKGAGVKVGSYS